MITWWLVIMISIAGGSWRPMEDTKMPSRKACEAAAAERWDYLENGHLSKSDGTEISEEYEVGVACQKHVSKADPA
jgi:hypothetical protein